VGRAGLTILAVLMIASAARAELDESLAALDQDVQDLLAGGLEAPQEKAVNKIDRALDKVEALPPEPVSKVLKAVGKVAKSIEKAGKKGVDLSVHAEQLSTDVADEADVLRGAAEIALEPLQLEKDRAKVQKGLDKGDKSAAKVDPAGPASKRIKINSKASKKYEKATATAVTLFQKEVDSGVLTLEVVSVTLEDGTPIADLPGVPWVTPLKITLNLKVDVGTIGEVVRLERAAQAYPAELVGGGVTETDMLVVNFPSVPPPETDTAYTLVIRGSDGSEPFMVSVHGVALKVTERIAINLLP
jgi:hypothetical protein